MPSKRGKLAGAPEPVQRTFLFSDIVSSTAIRDEYVRRHGKVQGNAKYLKEVLEPHDRRVKEGVAAFGGEVVSGEGIPTSWPFRTNGRPSSAPWRSRSRSSGIRSLSR